MTYKQASVTEKTNILGHASSDGTETNGVDIFEKQQKNMQKRSQTDTTELSPCKERNSNHGIDCVHHSAARCSTVTGAVCNTPQHP